MNDDYGDVPEMMMTMIAMMLIIKATLYYRCYLSALQGGWWI